MSFIILEQEKTSLRNLAEKILELKKSKLSISYKPRLSNTFVKSRIGSIEKAKKDINFIAETKLEYGLEKLIEWYEKKLESSYKNLKNLLLIIIK